MRRFNAYCDDAYEVEDGRFVEHADHQQAVAQLQARVAELEAKLTGLMASAFDLNFIAANDDGLDVNGKTASAISKHYHKARNV